MSRTDLPCPGRTENPLSESDTPDDTLDRPLVPPPPAPATGHPAPVDDTQSAPPSPTERHPLPRIIALANQKGGVGKTTTTVNLGAALAEMGLRTLIIDLDPQGNASTGLGIENRGLEHSMYHVLMHEEPLENVVEPTDVRNLFVAPASLDLAGAEIELVPAFSREQRLKRSIEAVLDDYDYVLIDCPPRSDC
jgi:chromosome partitioning protein